MLDHCNNLYYNCSNRANKVKHRSLGQLKKRILSMSLFNQPIEGILLNSVCRIHTTTSTIFVQKGSMGSKTRSLGQLNGKPSNYFFSRNNNIRNIATVVSSIFNKIIGVKTMSLGQVNLQCPTPIVGMFPIATSL